MPIDWKWFEYESSTLSFSECFDYSFYENKIKPKNWKFLPKNWIKVKDISDRYGSFRIPKLIIKYYKKLLDFWYIKKAYFSPELNIRLTPNRTRFNIEKDYYKKLYYWQYNDFNDIIICVWVRPLDFFPDWERLSHIIFEASFLELEDIIKAYNAVFSYWYNPATLELYVMSIKQFKWFGKYSKEKKQELLQIHKKHLERLIWLTEQGLNSKVIFSHFSKEWGRLHALEIPKKYSLWFLNMMLEGDTREI